MQKTLFLARDPVKVRALLVGQSIDVKELEKTDYLRAAPLMVKTGPRSCAVVFRYGAVVFFNLLKLLISQNYSGKILN